MSALHFSANCLPRGRHTNDKSNGDDPNADPYAELWCWAAEQGADERRRDSCDAGEQARLAGAENADAEIPTPKRACRVAAQHCDPAATTCAALETTALSRRKVYMLFRRPWNVGFGANCGQ
ncbi:MAG: hypothetical protein ABI206_17995 [Antricoccus sp.]